MNRIASTFLCALSAVALNAVALNSTAQAADLQSRFYGVYEKPGAGNSKQLFIVPKDNLLLLHGDPVTPVTFMPDVSGYQLTLNSDGSLSAVSAFALNANDLAADGSYSASNYTVFSGDLSGDGQRDLLLQGAANNASFILTDTGTPLVYYNFGTQLDQGVVQVSVAHFDGSGAADIIVTESNGYQFAWISSGTTTAGSFTSTASGTLASVPSPGAMPVVGQTHLDASTQVGSTAGDFRVDESGAATYSIPLVTAPGTAGVAPQLSLNYSSQAGNGLIGKGWSLGGLSAISRCRQTLHQDTGAKAITWSSEDRFCLDGQRLINVSGSSYGAPGSTYKTEIDSFVTVTAVGGTAGHPDYFTVERKDGSTSYYGSESTDASELAGDSANASTTTLSWAISRFTDSVGNAIDYLYDNDAAGQRLREIRYAYTATVATATEPAGSYQASVLFTYTDRYNNPTALSHADNISGYLTGYRFDIKKRLAKIETRSAGTPIREYTLNYKTADSNALIALSRLESIVECAAGYCLPATTFSWISPQEPTTETVYYQYMGMQIPVTTTSSGYGFETTASSSTQLSSQNDRHIMSHQFGDINADGIVDIIWVERDYSSSGSLNWRAVKYALGDGNGFGAATIFHSSNDSNQSYAYQLHVLDYNGDGRSDVILHRPSSTHTLKLFLAEPKGFDWGLSSSKMIDLGFAAIELMATDLDSDGLVDLVYRRQPSFDDVFVRYLKHAGQPVTSDTYYSYGSEQLLFSITSLGSPEPGYPLSDYFDPFWWAASRGSVDFNGDGRVDLLVGSSLSRWIAEPGPMDPGTSINVEQLRTLLSTGTSLSAINNPSTPTTYETVRPGGVAIDLNADGLTDLLYRQGNSYSWYFALSNGQGFETGQLAIADSEVGFTLDLKHIQTLDYNHDGHPDIVWHNTQSNKLEGKLWQPQTNNFGTTFTVRTTNGDANEVHLFIDFNGDGNTDYIHLDANVLKTYPSKGSGEPRHVIARITNGVGMQTDIVYGALSTSGHYGRLTVDTSTGSQTQCEYYAQPNDPYCFETPLTINDTTSFYQKLNGPWVLPEGNHVLGKDANKDGVDDPVLELNGPIYVVNRVSGSAPTAVDANAKSSISYYYGEAKIQASGRGLLGFEYVKTVDDQTNIVTTTTYRQDFPFIGYPLSTVVNVPTGSTTSITLSESTNTWQLQGWDGVSSAPAAPYRPYISKSVEKKFDPETGVLLSQVQTDTGYLNPYGNPDWITVTTTGDGAVYKTETVNTYGPTTWEQEKGRLIKTEVTQKRGADELNLVSGGTRTSTFTYQSQALGGMLLSETIEPDNAAFTLTTTYTYDNVGNKLTTTTGSGASARVTTREYDASSRFLTKTYNAYGQTTQEVLTRNALGQPLTVKDIHGTITTFAYDAFGTPYLQYSQTGHYTINLKAPASTACPTGTAFMQRKSVAGGASSKTCFDVLARPVRHISTGFAGEDIYQDTVYDNLGRVTKTSLPYFSYNSPGANDWTINTYDLTGRITRVTLPDTSTVQTDYQGRTTVVTNALSQTRTETRNALGELTRAVDNQGSEIRYNYDPAGHLLSTQVAGTHYATGINSTNDPMITSMTYDLLGRKTSMNDPDKGHWQYTRYNVFGELEEQINANGQKVVMSYDRLGRMIQRVDHNSTGTVVETTQWTYDESSTGTGLLQTVAASTSGHAKLYSYDSFGRIEQTNTVLGLDGSYTESTSYDAYGRVFQQIDATGKGIQNNYNRYGYQHLIQEALIVNGSQDTLYQVSAMNAQRQVTHAMLANGYTTQHGYDSQTGRITSISTDLTAGLGQVQHITYTYDALGNVLTRTNTSGSKNLNERFCYDTLNRLTAVQQNGAACGTDQITYDSFGNITSKNGNSYTYGEGNAGPHAVTRVSNTGYQYDANGNMTGDNDVATSAAIRTITYSTFDKPTLITKGSDSVSFTYGVERSRFKRVDVTAGVTTTTLYMGNVEKVINHSDNSYELKRYVPGNSLLIDRFDSNDVLIESRQRTLLKDALGSVDIILNGADAIEQELSFDAWGLRRGVVNGASTDWTQAFSPFLPAFDVSNTKRGYTGHEHVDSMGIIHMNGRIYDAKLGRFLQADPFVDGVTNTQGYNRYSYALNNPLKYTDPSGHLVFSLGAAIILAAKGVTDLVVIGLVMGVAGFADALAQGASFGDALKSGIIQGVSAAAFASVSGGFDFGSSTWGETAMLGLEFGAIGGITSVLQGGKFGHGFVSAGASAFVGKGLAGSFGKSIGAGGNVLARAVVGGTLSKATGGKFANGAVTAAFAAIASQIAQDSFSTGKNHKDLKTPQPSHEAPGVSAEHEAKMSEAAMVDEVKMAEATATTPKSPPNPAPYSRTGIVEEVVVTGQYTGATATVPPAYVTPTVTPEQFIAIQYAGVNAQQARVFRAAAAVVPAGRALGAARAGWAAASPPLRRALVNGLGHAMGEVVAVPPNSGLPRTVPPAAEIQVPGPAMRPPTPSELYLP